MKKVIFIFGISLISNYLQAQGLTLNDCIAKTIANNTEIKTSQIQAEAAQSNLLLVKRNILPTVGFGIEQSGNFGRSIDRFTNSYISQFYNTTYSGIQFSMPVFNSFQNKNEIAQNDKQVKANLYAIEARKNEMTFNTIAAYMAVLGNYELVNVAKNQLNNITSQKLRISKLLEAGLVSNIDDLQVQNQTKTDEISLSEAQMNYETSKVVLFQIMNLAYDKTAVFEDNSLAKKDLNLLFDQEKSIANLADIRQLNEIHSAQSFGIKALKASNLPSIRLSGSYGLFYASSNRERSFSEQLDDTRNGSVSIGLNIPIFRKFINSPRIQNLQIQQKLTSNTIEQTKNQLRQQIETAEINYKAAEIQWKNTIELEQIANKTMQLVKQQIEIGTIKMVDFLLAQSNFEKAASHVVQAKYRLLLQQKYLQFYQTGSFGLE